MIKHMIYTIFGIIIVIIVYILLDDKPIRNSFTKEYEIQEVKFEGLSDTIFLKQVIWGMSSEAKITAISSVPGPNIYYESKSDFIYKSGATLFYKKKGDTLHILSMEIADKPATFNSDVVISQDRIENQTFNQLIIEYSEKGLLKFPK